MKTAILLSIVAGPRWKSLGTTYQGGANNRGTVFNISKAGAVQKLHEFL
jgi:uncharacterized repeat protein (TIGR03803 family)